VAPRVLLIDDNPQDRILARRALAAEFPDLELTEITDQAQLDGALRHPAFDIVVTDYQLRWSDGLKVLEAMHAIAPDLPVVMFTNTGSEEIAASGLRLRLSDYIVKTSGHYVRLAHGVRVVLNNAADRKAIESERQRTAERAAFMSEASSLLATSLDYETTLAAVANLAVPKIGDWCAVDIVNEDRTLARLAVAHVDPSKVQFARSLNWSADVSDPASAASVTRTAKSVLVPVITDQMIEAVGHGNEQQLQLIRQLGLLSYICVPLIAHGRTLGALTLATAESHRQYTDDDLRFAEAIAHRAALAVDNAQAYKAMQVADRLKDEFLATLSHELRTPLNAILGYARLLRTGSITAEKTPRALEIVERNAAALTQLVDDVLDVSRVISGKVRLNIQPVDLPNVVRTAVESLQPAVAAKGLRLQTVIDPQAAPISGDPDRLQQIVWNLVSNAVKFTPKGGRIQVRLERNDSQVDVVVSDTGVGIKPEFLPHIFERFRQADSATTRQYGGLGLGLAIVRHLVELHGGTVEAASGGAGRGATFRVRLPVMILHPEPAVDERRARVRIQRPVLAPTPGKLGAIHVMAIDDDNDALSLVQEILELAGARVTTVDSGASALELLAAIRPDVVIADVGMPDIDGFELIRRIRRSPDAQVRHIPAIALTAYARSADRVRALESGFEMHLSKPADPAELIAAIAAAAKRKRE
jgi:hypothetical protein